MMASAAGSRQLCLWIAGLLALTSCTTGCQAPTASDAADHGDASGEHPLFEEIQEQVQLRFTHDPGTPGSWFFPEIMVSGAALLDYDRDGDLDVYLLNCGAPPLPPGVRDARRARNRLFRQEADGRFTDATDRSGLGDEGYSIGVAVGDVNNDGNPDVFVTNYGRDRLYLNLGNGQFQDITDASGIHSDRWSSAACFLDYDRDGWLDLYVANYVDYFPTRACFGASGRRDYCSPAGFDKTVDHLYHNATGQKTDPNQVTGGSGVSFQDVTVAAGITQRSGSGLGVTSGDFNDDGWTDLYVANDMVGNFLWINQRDGQFRDEAMVRGVAYDTQGRPQASMGIAMGDLNHDRIPDLYVTHMAGEANALYVSDGTLGHRELAVRHGLCRSLLRYTTFGAALLDIDHDGLEDVVAVNGSMKLPDSAIDVPLCRPGHATDADAYWKIFGEPNQILLQAQDGMFQQASHPGELFARRREVSRGLCTGDIDGDGDLDLLVVNTAAPVRLYRNIAPKRGHWLRVQAVEPARGGRNAYGARITVQSGPRQWVRWINPSSSYLSCQDPVAHFGLGPIDEITSIEVRWPDGQLELFPGGPVDQRLCLEQSGAPASSGKTAHAVP